MTESDDYKSELEALMADVDGSGASLSAVKMRGKITITSRFGDELKQAREWNKFLEMLKMAFEAQHPELSRRKRRGLLGIFTKKSEAQKHWEFLMDDILHASHELTKMELQSNSKR